jgi:nicotinamidase-related amidase
MTGMRTHVEDDASSGATTWSGYREKGLGARQPRGSRPALVVVDLTYAFTDPESSLGCDAALALDTVAELLQTARDNDAPCVFTRIIYATESDLVAARPFVEKLPDLTLQRPGTRWTEIDARVAPAPGEAVLDKLFASAFWGTSLASLLVSSGCDSVIVAGASTSGCVRATVVDAMQHGYRVLVPRDGVADRARGPHDAALFDIQGKYGEVVATEEALASLRGRPAETMGATR